MANLSTYAATQEHLAQPAPEETIPVTNTENTNVDTTQVATNGQENSNGQAAAPTLEENAAEFKIDLGVEQVAPATPQEPPKPTFNWKDEIKKVDPNELLKEVGVSEFALELDKHIKAGGQPIDYLNAKGVDYNKFSDEELVKDNMKKQFPNLSSYQIDLMFNRKYVVGEDALDEDKEYAKAQLQADGYNIRKSKIAEQQKFKIADGIVPPKDEEYEQWKTLMSNRPAEIEKERNFYNNHTATKSLHESKRVAINVGKDIQPFNFVIDRPEVITQTLTDDGALWRKLTSTETGEPDVQKQQLITLFAINPQKFIQDIYNYGEQMGVKRKVVGEGQNAQRPIQKGIPPELNGKPTYSTGRYGDKQRE